MEIIVKLANIPMRIKLRHSETLPFFEDMQTDLEPITSVYVSDDRLELVKEYYTESTSEISTEYYELCRAASDALLPYGGAVFHALAFKWKGRAWLITAPSGTGKTTHYIQWKRQFSDELTIMNGDKPIIRMDDSGSITVYPSPWYGKEGIHRLDDAPLGGIVILEQQKENRIRRLDPAIDDALLVGRIFAQFLFTCSNAKQVEQVSRLEEALLKYPIWLLQNRGDLESAQLCREALGEVIG